MQRRKIHLTIITLMGALVCGCNRSNPEIERELAVYYYLNRQLGYDNPASYKSKNLDDSTLLSQLKDANKYCKLELLNRNYFLQKNSEPIYIQKSISVDEVKSFRLCIENIINPYTPIGSTREIIRIDAKLKSNATITYKLLKTLQDTTIIERSFSDIIEAMDRTLLFTDLNIDSLNNFSSKDSTLDYNSHNPYKIYSLEIFTQNADGKVFYRTYIRQNPTHLLKNIIDSIISVSERYKKH